MPSEHYLASKNIELLFSLSWCFVMSKSVIPYSELNDQEDEGLLCSVSIIWRSFHLVLFIKTVIAP